MPASGLDRLNSIFTSLRTSGRKALMPFIVGGRPSIDALPDVLRALDAAGADVVEIGIPFSDPIADGPVIAGAMHHAIADRVTPLGVLDAVAKARPSVSCGLVAMVSVSIVQRLGISRFLAAARDAGIDGCIFPDAPLEESVDLAHHTRAVGLSSSLLVALSTPAPRAQSIARASTGFVYMLARRGITGTPGATPDDALRERIRTLRQATTLPIACGFGITTADDVRTVVHLHGADAAIVGTAMVRAIEDAQASNRDVPRVITDLMSSLRRGLNP